MCAKKPSAMTFFSFNTSSKSFPPQIWIEQLNTKKPRVHEQFYVTASQRVEPRIYNIFRASRLTSRFGREARPGSEVGSTENNIIYCLIYVFSRPHGPFSACDTFYLLHKINTPVFQQSGFSYNHWSSLFVYVRK